MRENHTYEVSLTPRGVPLEDASETRAFDIPLDPDLCEADQLEQATEHIIENRLIDPWAFRNHWDIARIANVDPNERLRDALRSLTRARNPKENEVPYTLYVEDQASGHRKLTSLTIPRQLRTDVRDFVDALLDEDDGGTKLTDVHAAMISVAADSNPDIADELTSDPADGAIALLNTALQQESSIRDRLGL